MPGKSKIEVKCKKCGKVFEAEVIDHVDLHEDRDLIKQVKSGKINRVVCPKCKKVMYLDRSIVINFDPDNLIVIYDPAATTQEARDVIMRNYQGIVSYNEILEEVGQDTEFKILSDKAQLKKLIDKYIKEHNT
ncbi:MAG: CpXC domain-containing protein [Candidatus Thorarchaeota archaeon]|nr:CpXC domain-containing protein [Candidatus Thorarchaeota archaeon]